jgi:hypothetical protein
MLLNVVANAVHGPDMALLQGRRAASVRGFAVASPMTRSAWRITVIAGGPGLLGLLALWRHRHRCYRHRRRSGVRT